MPVHLVGSVALGSEREVFEAASEALGPLLHAFPDGETGVRANWLGWQLPRLAASAGLSMTINANGPYAARSGVGLAAGARVEDVVLCSPGYAEHALASYAVFAAEKRAGRIPGAARFQVSIPTAIALLTHFDTALQDAIYPQLLDVLANEVGVIAAGIPHHELALQWDVAIEFAVLELGLLVPFAEPRAEIVRQLVRLGAGVPANVHLGYHFCYGDSGHKHFKEPADTSLLVGIANELVAGSRRSIEWLHMPVPRSRDDTAYFAPLRGFEKPEDMTLYLGLVHRTDGVDGGRRRIAAASAAVPEFGIATECGMGRRLAETIRPLLELHRTLALGSSLSS